MARNVASTAISFGTSTGPAAAYGLAVPTARVTAVVESDGSTGVISTQIQGRVGLSEWVNISSVTSSTGVFALSSTGEGVAFGHNVTSARVNLTANASTAGGTIWMVARS